LKVFTQNIDCLERLAGVPGESIVEGHGSFATQSCIECKKAFPDEAMLAAISHKTAIPRCLSCDGLVKPDITFFGENLPPKFFQNLHVVRDADLAIILGTSLTVYPFARLPLEIPYHVPRLLINLEQVGNLGSRRYDVIYIGQCDEGVRKLAKACGWLEELETKWARATNQKVAHEKTKKTAGKSKDQKLQEGIHSLEHEMLRLTNKIRTVLRVDDSQISSDECDNEVGLGDSLRSVTSELDQSDLPNISNNGVSTYLDMTEHSVSGKFCGSSNL